MLVVCSAWFSAVVAVGSRIATFPSLRRGGYISRAFIYIGRSAGLLTLARLAGVLGWASLAFSAFSPLFILLSLVGFYRFSFFVQGSPLLTGAPLPPLSAPFPSVAHTHLGLNQWLPNHPLGRGSVTGWARSVVHGGTPAGGVGGGLVLVRRRSAVWWGSFSVCFLCHYGFLSSCLWFAVFVSCWLVSGPCSPALVLVPTLSWSPLTAGFPFMLSAYMYFELDCGLYM